jgi:sec-independent protein translocase protein TatC
MGQGYEIDPKRMSFLDHLGELRGVLIHSLIFFFIGLALAWGFSGYLLDLLIVRLKLDTEGVQFLSPMEPFNARFKVAAIVALMVSLPAISLRVWAFVAPALRMTERAVIVPSALATSVLFILGTGFSVFVLSPLMLDLLMGFGTDHARANLALGPVLSFVLRMSLACAILFQLPLLLALTTLMGLTSPRFLLSKWRHAVVAIFVVAAVATPGDGPSQIILAAPLVVLYFLSVLVSSLIWRARGRTNAAERARSRDQDGPGNGEGGPSTNGSPPPASPGGVVPADEGRWSSGRGTDDVVWVRPAPGTFRRGATLPRDEEESPDDRSR